MADYPEFVESCGWQDVQGIGGANCRHSFYPFLPGIMEPAYTQEELDNIDPPPFEYQGKEYTRYEATQKQREIEYNIRRLKVKHAGKKAAGLDKEASIIKGRINRLQEEYIQFSKAAGLGLQTDRMNVLISW